MAFFLSPPPRNIIMTPYYPAAPDGLSSRATDTCQTKLRGSISPAPGRPPARSPFLPVFLHLFCQRATIVVVADEEWHGIVPARSRGLPYPHRRQRQHTLEPCSLAPHRQQIAGGSGTVATAPPVALSLTTRSPPARTIPVPPSVPVCVRPSVHAPSASFFPFMVTTLKRRGGGGFSL